jgi:hypothetical protein
MSALFTLETPSGDTLWSPSLHAGLLFVSDLRAAEKMVGIAAGITDWAKDSYIVDASQLELFVAALRQRAGNHQIVDLLLHPTVVISIALLQRTGRELVGLQDDLAEAVQVAGSHMPR